MKQILIVSVLGLSAWGCANLLNAITADRYNTQCREAENNAQLNLANEACRRALINVRLGNLGPAAEAWALYNYGRIRRRLGAYSEAEAMYKESLRLEATLRARDQRLIYYGSFELALVLDEQGKCADAWPSLSRLVAMSNGDYGDENEQRMVKDVFSRFADAYNQLQMMSEADILRKRADAL